MLYGEKKNNRIPVSISKDVFISILIIAFVFFFFDFLQSWIDMELTFLNYIQIFVYFGLITIFLVVIFIIRKKIEWIKSIGQRGSLIVSIELSLEGGIGTKLIILIPEIVFSFSMGRIIVAIILLVLFSFILGILIYQARDGDKETVGQHKRIRIKPAPPRR